MIEQLSDTERTEKGTPSHWSAKETVAHITAWKRQAALRLAAAIRGEKRSDIDNVDGFNAQVFEEQQSRTWSDVESDMKCVYAELATYLQSSTETDLLDTRRFVWRDNEPLWKLVMCDGYEHPIQHLSGFYLKRENVARATEIQIAAVETMAQFFKDTDYYSYALYNLGCLYAKTNRADEALPVLHEALRLNSDLVAELQQYPELDSLRTELIQAHHTNKGNKQR